MPVLERPENTAFVELPSRTARIAGEADVLVVGGGPAGMAAAWGAATGGASVILTERYGFLGGNATAALVTMFTTYYTRARRLPRTGTVTLYPTDHGPGEPAIAGFLALLVERLVRTGGALPPSLQNGHTVPFDPEVFKLVAVDLMDEAGVRILFHSFASGVLGAPSRPEGVVFETKSGPVAIRARAVVDCTGDGDIAAAAGAPYEVGRPEDGLVQPMTLYYRMVGFDREDFAAYVHEHPDQWEGVYGLWDLVRKAAESGELDLPREDILFFPTPSDQEISLNCTRVIRVFGTDVWDLTYAEYESRRQMRQIAAFMRKYVPGFRNAYVVQSGVNAGVRESRRITGEYVLTGEDVLAARKFEDVIARGTYPLDIHNPLGRGTVLKRLPPGEAYDIPVRCLIPRDVDNLLVAGRCISGTHEALASYRVMPICAATGQAAGVCAALAARQKVPPRAVASGDVQDELLRQKADLGDRRTPSKGGCRP